MATTKRTTTRKPTSRQPAGSGGKTAATKAAAAKGGPLAEYQRKRDFSRTAEPAGGDEVATRKAAAGDGATPPPKGSATGRFVVQRHRARRLHYDLRFEIDGVLASWAVPKGPTLDPTAKRLAVRTEDHPIEYMTFEGVIPAGEYGGGDVIVWDWGTWELHGADDAAKAVEAGELHAEVHGEKLKGRLVLVRSGRPGDGGNQWLLLHKRDEHAERGWDAEDHPHSVRTGRTNDEVAADRDAVWLSDAPADVAEIDLSAAKAEDLPASLEPMVAQAAKVLPDEKGWLFGLRWPGRRAQVRVEGNRAEVIAADGERKPIEGLLRGRPARWTGATSALFEAVIVRLDPEGRPVPTEDGEASAVAPGRGATQVQLLDLLHLDGRTLVDVSLADRLRLLDAIVRPDDRVRVVRQTEGNAADFEALAAREPQVIVMARRSDSPYRPGKRSKDWQELAATTDAAGRPTPRQRTKAAKPRHRGASTDERHRAHHPDDGRAAEIAALDELGKGGTWHFAGRELKLTNLDKVLFPAEGRMPAVTKRDLVRYYAETADVALPYYAGRPLNMHRYPDGTAKKGFWYKTYPSHAPSWIRSWRYPDANPGETQEYLIVEEAATIPWLANFGAIELHPWNACAVSFREPSFAYIDIDPGTATSWDDVLTLARLYRTALDRLDVAGWPKVTGRRGIQIWVPVTPGLSFDDTRDWVEALSRVVASPVPDLVSWAWEVKARKGLARLDFTQNAINKTLVAPYSVRPAPGAPVSVPITWDELDDADLRPDRWTIRDVGERLATKGDPFATMVGFTQELPPLG